MVEVIEFNVFTRKRKIKKFKDFDEAISFIKKNKNKVEIDGYTYTICNLIDVAFSCD